MKRYFIIFREAIEDRESKHYDIGDIISVDEDNMFKWIEYASENNMKITVSKGTDVCVIN